jgi:hypothetical protein
MKGNAVLLLIWLFVSKWGVGVMSSAVEVPS